MPAITAKVDRQIVRSSTSGHSCMTFLRTHPGYRTGERSSTGAGPAGNRGLGYVQVYTVIADAATAISCFGRIAVLRSVCCIEADVSLSLCLAAVLRTRSRDDVSILQSGRLARSSV